MTTRNSKEIQTNYKKHKFVQTNDSSEINLCTK